MTLNLEAWVASVFDHPDAKPEWQRPTARILQVVTELFEHPAAPLKRFSDAQLDQGFWFLCQGGGPMRGLIEELIPWEIRLRCIRSLVTLFRDLYAVRCTRHLSHLDRVGGKSVEVSPLNSSCYMWWDFDCWVARPDHGPGRRVDAAFLEVMQSILTMPHEACRESALHGLGHWHHGYPAETGRIIDEFLASSRHISDHLRTYAGCARTGCIL